MYAKKLIRSLTKWPSVFHFCSDIRRKLSKVGFEEYKENEIPQFAKSGFVIRHNRSVIAWKYNGHESFVASCSHCDYPHLKISGKPEAFGKNNLTINLVKYGGITYNTWVDRNLKMVGRILVLDENGEPKSILYDSVVTFGVIPSNSAMNSLTGTLNSPVDIKPIPMKVIINIKETPTFADYIAQQIHVKKENILSWNLQMVNFQPPSVFSGMIHAQGLDNLENTFTSLEAFLQSSPEIGSTIIFAAFDSEEISSSTSVGAKSDFFESTLQSLLGEELQKIRLKSLILSVDSGHGAHPLYPDSIDSNTKVNLGKGLIIERENGGTTSSTPLTEIIPRLAAQRINENIQGASEKNTKSSGSTIGPILEKLIGVPTVDAGICLLSMHSIRELGSIKDVDCSIKILVEIMSHYRELCALIN